MNRSLFLLLAVVAAGIGYVAGASWLYVVAVLLLLVPAGLYGRDLFQEYQREQRRREKREGGMTAPDDVDEEEELRSLGIMDVRPRQKTGEEPPAGASPAGAPSDEEDAPTSKTDPVAPASAEPEGSEGTSRQAGGARRDRPAAAPDEDVDDELPGWMGDPAALEDDASSREAPVLTALVHAARLAAGARAACLLLQEELALSYRIEAIDAAAEAPALREAGTTFSTEAALLSAGASREPVTCRPVGGGGGLAPSLLGYYRAPGAWDDAQAPAAVALVPVPLPEASTTRFLVLDGPAGAFEGKDTLLKRFAALVAQVIDPPEEPAPQTQTSAPPESTAPETPAAPRTSANGQAPEPEEAPVASHPSPPRPRREIIAEEMEQARADGRGLGLALVYLNRAEAVAEQGDDEVRAAERALRVRLRHAAPGSGRVERFGELTYGVFLPYGRAKAEQWAVALEDELREARDPLEGGVSVGLTLMRGPEQSPDELRQNATHALGEAVATGTCTVLE